MMALQSVHKWRLFAPDEAEDSFQISKAIHDIADLGLIDTWFKDGKVVFGGSGEPPVSSHIKSTACNCDGGCEDCCFSGHFYRWVETPDELVLETIEAIKLILADLQTPLS